MLKERLMQCYKDIGKMFAESSTVEIASAESWSISSISGDQYVVQIGFPRNWVCPTTVETRKDPVPILYLTDGNSVFLSALETLHRRLSVKPQPFSAGVIVAIGYPLPPDSATVMDPRRTRDLTPPSPGCGPGEGGADDFARFIQERVKPIVYRRIKEVGGAVPGKEAIFGHSLGGLFSLHLLFTKPTMFDCFVASSPSIWWNKEFILQELSQYLERGKKETSKSLMLFVGGLEENPRQRRGESDEDYQKKKKRHQDRKMKQNLFAVHRQLEESRILEHLSVMIYEGEDHGTVIPCSLSQSLATFFEDWPFSERKDRAGIQS